MRASIAWCQSYCCTVHASGCESLPFFCSVMISLWLICRLATALDSDSNISVMTHLSIFLPLVGMCITIAICYPITLANSTRYHVSSQAYHTTPIHIHTLHYQYIIQYNTNSVDRYIIHDSIHPVLYCTLCYHIPQHVT